MCLIFFLFFLGKNFVDPAAFQRGNPTPVDRKKKGGIGCWGSRVPKLKGGGGGSPHPNHGHRVGTTGEGVRKLVFGPSQFLFLLVLTHPFPPRMGGFGVCGWGLFYGG